MKLVLRIQSTPEGTPLKGISPRVRRESDHSTITTLDASDADGWVSWTFDGHPEPFYLHIPNLPGGDKYWRSKDAGTVGVISLKELPAALRALGDGVIRGYLGELAPSLVSGGPSLAIASGAANIVGHPTVYSKGTTITNTRPVSGTRIDRVTARVFTDDHPTHAGLAYLILNPGVVDSGSAIAMPPVGNIREISLALVTVPSAGAITLTDDREFASERGAIVAGETRLPATLTTTNTSGAALPGAEVALFLPRTMEYVVEGTLATRQKDIAPTTQWVVQATYGPPFGSLGMTQPSQVAVDSTGRILIAETGKDYLLILNSSGVATGAVTGLTDVTGVCVDASDNIYVTYFSAGYPKITKYTSLLAAGWTRSFSLGPSQSLRHVATDGTSVYATVTDATVRKILCLTGADGSPAVFGGYGAGNGQFNAPWGIFHSMGYLSIVDQGNARVQILTTTGGYEFQWPVAAGSRGISIASTGVTVVAEYAQNRVRGYFPNTVVAYTIAQNSPSGIAVATGDVVWVSNAAGSVAKWDEVATPGGYGEVAVDINGNLGGFLGIGNRNGSVSNMHELIVQGPATATLRAFAKATTNTMTLTESVLTGRARPRS
jgi:hypothetical protein